jgi:hypothetical protein
MKQLKDYSWDELVDEQVLRIHAGLLTGGGKGFKDAVSLAMETAVRQYKESHVAVEKPDSSDSRLRTVIEESMKNCPIDSEPYIFAVKSLRSYLCCGLKNAKDETDRIIEKFSIDLHQ